MLRILSDIHFRDANTRLRRLEDLDPLLEGVDELWLNGDTCDNQTGLPPAIVDDICQYFRQRVPRVRFITGNHDPDISDEHEASAAGGRLWAVHGDVFLDDIVPWSRLLPELRRRVRTQRDLLSQLDFDALPDRFQILRAACLGFGRECDPERSDTLYRLGRLFTEFFPPRQPLAMLKTWRTFPDLAIAGARRWRPEAQVIVTGHVHFPRVWRRRDHIVINTGAFSGPLGAYAVDLIDDETVRVHRVAACPRGWTTGELLTEFPLASAAAAPLSRSA